MHVHPLGIGVALLFSIAACAHSSLPGNSASAEGTRRGTVLVASQLQESSSSNLLSALRMRIAGMQVSPGASCPGIMLRGQHSMHGDNNPAVYVDGTRALNTCVLDMLFPIDVERVEVYPMGVAPRPPYKAHPNGLILVFMGDGRPDR